MTKSHKNRHKRPPDTDVNVVVNVDDDDSAEVNLIQKILDLEVKILAQLDDLKAAQAATSTRVDEVAAEIAALIASGAAPTDLTDVIAAEVAIKAKLDAIPPVPVV